MSCLTLEAETTHLLSVQLTRLLNLATPEHDFDAKISICRLVLSLSANIILQLKLQVIKNLLSHFSADFKGRFFGQIRKHCSNTTAFFATKVTTKIWPKCTTVQNKYEEVVRLARVALNSVVTVLIGNLQCIKLKKMLDRKLNDHSAWFSFCLFVFFLSNVPSSLIEMA